MSEFIVGLVVAVVICALYAAWERMRKQHGRMRAPHGGAGSA